MKYLDISVQHFSGQYTIAAKKLGLTAVKILEKCPKLNLTMVRLLGTTEAICAVLEKQFPARVVYMHVAAIREASPETLEPLARKNKGLRENLKVTM